MTDKQSNELKIGNKPFFQYMRSIELLLRKQGKKKIILRARGLNIKTAVDLAEASKNKFLDELNISIGKIKTSTVTFEDKGRELAVSCIDIEILSK